MSEETLADTTEHLETEAKLGASPDLVIPDLSEALPDLALSPAPTLTLEAVYFDTVDLALARSKVSLRHRTGEGDARWTLKLPKGRSGPVDHDGPVAGTLRRREIEVLGDDGETVPSSLASLVTGWARGEPLGPVVTLRSTRRRIELRADRGGDVLGEIDDDTVDVLREGVHVETFREIEVEVTDRATNDVLPTVVAALRFAGAHEADPTSKVGRALGLAGAVPPLPLGVVIDRDATVGDLARAALSRGTAALVAADHAIRLDEDPVAVRRAAAAVRRLRADLRLLRSHLDREAVDRLRDELDWYQAQLARVRRLDVLGARLDQGLARLDPDDRAAGGPLVDHLRTVREMTRSALVTSMTTPTYVAMLRAGVAASAQPPGLCGGSDAVAGRMAKRLARRPVRRVEREVATLEARSVGPSDEQIRKLRRRVRQARYSLELVGPVLPESHRSLTQALVAAQDQLGALRDSVETEEWLRTTAEVFANPSLSLIAGQLITRQREEADSVRSGWQGIVEGIAHPMGAFLRR